MWIKHNRVLPGKVSILLVMLLAGSLIFLGCARGSIPQGWSGVEEADGTLFLGSMDGKLVAIDIPTHNRTWEVELPARKQSAAFGCAPASTTVAIYGTPAASGDLIYVGGYDGRLYAYSFGKYESKWTYPREVYIEPIIGGAVVALDKVYFGGSDGKVYALDAADGYKEWEFQTGDKIWSTPVISGDTLYIGSFDKKLYALSAIDGSKMWKFETEGGIAASPLVYDNTVYIGSFDRHLYAVDANDGSLIWQSNFEAGRWFWAKPIIYENVIYAGNLDGKVYVVNAETGEKINEFDLGSPVSSSPVLVDGSVIFASQDGQLWTIDTGNNQKSLLADVKNLAAKELTIHTPLSAGDGVVYVHAQTKKQGSLLYVLNAQTGAVLWSLPLGN